MDGARFANALAALDVPPRSITWEVGVDVLCLGGTKNGMGMGDAVVFWCPVGHMATLVNLKDGATLRTIDMPQVEHLEADSIEAGGFVAWNGDGRIERLSPLAGAAAPAAAAAAAK